MAPRRRWTAAREAHQRALDELARSALAVPPDRWLAPRAPGKWSPAQETLHVARSYEAALDEIDGGQPMRPRVTPMRARLLRWFYLPRLLQSGHFPPVAAPVEIRPNEVEAEFCEAAALVERVRERARTCEEALEVAARGGGRVRLSHPYFGPLRPLAALRLLTVHTAHHARRLARDGAGAGPAVA